jgi:hypothetical protein
MIDLNQNRYMIWMTSKTVLTSGSDIKYLTLVMKSSHKTK